MDEGVPPEEEEIVKSIMICCAPKDREELVFDKIFILLFTQERGSNVHVTVDGFTRGSYCHPIA